MSEKIRLCHVRAQADFCVPAAARKERKMYIIILYKQKRIM